MENVEMIKINQIRDFENHPFKVKNDEKMKNLSDSIEQNGFIIPAIVRKTKEGNYEMISGHRRKFAAELIGMNEIPCIVKELSDIEAVCLMVDSNINQREEILPSEKAKAYKMKMDAIRHQGSKITVEVNKRIKDILNVIDPDKTSCQDYTNLRSDEILSKNSDDSSRQIQRYIKINDLIPELLDMLDEKKIAFSPGVELAFINEENQYLIFESMKYNECTPSVSQAILMKNLDKDNKLTPDKINEILTEDKPNQVERIKINANKFEKYFPANVISNQQKEDFLLMCVKKYFEKNKNKER